jgi:hephaestin
MDGSSVIWMYHSHADEERDVASGLLGPLIITRKGMARADGTPKDVDRELAILMDLGNENHSWYLHDSVRRFAKYPERANYANKDFRNWNNVLSMNGFLFGNMPMPTMHAGGTCSPI